MWCDGCSDSQIVLFMWCEGCSDSQIVLFMWCDGYSDPLMILKQSLHLSVGEGEVSIASLCVVLI